jgi:hypothetical protein
MREAKNRPCRAQARAQCGNRVDPYPRRLPRRCASLPSCQESGSATTAVALRPITCSSTHSPRIASSPTSESVTIARTTAQPGSPRRGRSVRLIFHLLRERSKMTLLSVPIVDIAPYWTGGDAGKRAVAAAVDRACRDIGFLIISGHGIPGEGSACPKGRPRCRQLYALHDHRRRDG